jgi:hypothetical protein
MKAYWGSAGIAPQIFDLALDGDEWSASRHCRSTPRERALGIQWIGGWADPRAVLDAVVKSKIPSPPPGIETSNSDRPTCSLVVITTELSELGPLS